MPWKGEAVLIIPAYQSSDRHACRSNDACSLSASRDRSQDSFWYRGIFFFWFIQSDNNIKKIVLVFYGMFKRVWNATNGCNSCNSCNVSLLFQTNIKGLEYGSVTSPVGWGLSLGTSPDLWGSMQRNNTANLHVHK
jgi:hypothetical protein